MPVSTPKFIQTPFANSGAKNDVPQTSDQPAGLAGYDVGFPPLTMTPVAAGGIPPSGQDMNGVLFDLSKAIQYAQSGVLPSFDSTFATAIGGYAIGAIVADSTDKSIIWYNGTANNTSAPGVSGWTRLSYGAPTETVRGMPLLATNAESIAMIATGKAIDPAKLGAVFAAFTASNVGSSRALGVTYTNTSKAPRFVNIQGTTIVAGGGAQVDVAGIPVIGSSYPEIGRSVAVSAIVPVGATYIAPTGNMTLARWMEVSL